MDELKRMIKAAKAQGLQVIAPEELTTYFWITDGQRIGYAQADRLRGPTFSTVHKANKYTGTGYAARDMAEALQHKPSWAANGGSTVHKWSGPAEFIAKHWQPLKQY
jgi:hypothetical protein